ncbi:helix-turn-helix domain-containing protein [Subtercola boreus]|uniref:helix-turn-helix domain-containing protein n=1 Tax=Subtercola boreus TaxID=120213 RepID=UPI00345F78E1
MAPHDNVAPFRVAHRSTSAEVYWARVGRPRGLENVQYKAKAREEFFRRLDRGGTIRAVAAELGVSVDACYRWRREANISTPRAKSRSYTAEEKAEFFRQLKLATCRRSRKSSGW